MELGNDRCGRCRRYIKLVETKPVRLHCGACDETFAVPQNGVIREFQENRCPLDDFQLLVWSGGAKGKSFTFCPYCYNNPPFLWVSNSACYILWLRWSALLIDKILQHISIFVKYKWHVSYLCRDMSKGAGCNLCSHPTCRYSRDNVGVSQCMECPTGILVMDPASGPKWKLACNRSVLYHHLVLEHHNGSYSVSFILSSQCKSFDTHHFVLTPFAPI